MPVERQKQSSTETAVTSFLLRNDDGMPRNLSAGSSSSEGYSRGRVHIKQPCLDNTRLYESALVLSLLLPIIK
jgi:hypothetical protein